MLKHLRILGLNISDIPESSQKNVSQWTDKNGKKHDQIKIKAAEWQGGNITIQFYDKDANQSINLIYLKESTPFEEKPQAMSTPIDKIIEDDSPF